MAFQVPGVLLVRKDKWEKGDLKEILVLQDQEGMLEIEDNEEK